MLLLGRFDGSGSPTQGDILGVSVCAVVGVPAYARRNAINGPRWGGWPRDRSIQRKRRNISGNLPAHCLQFAGDMKGEVNTSHRESHYGTQF